MSHTNLMITLAYISTIISEIWQPVYSKCLFYIPNGTQAVNNSYMLRWLKEPTAKMKINLRCASDRYEACWDSLRQLSVNTSNFTVIKSVNWFISLYINTIINPGCYSDKLT